MLKEALHYFIKIALKTTLRIYHVFPVRENRITLLNDMSYTYGDSMKYLYLYIKKKRKNRYEIVYPLKSLPRKRPQGVITVKKNTLQYYYYLLTSRVIITNAGGVSFIPKRKGQMIINTWHGGGPYKKTSTDVFNNFFYRKEVQMNAGQIDYVLSTCEYCTRMEYPAMKIERSKCINSGMPRNDIFFQNRPDILNKVRKCFKLEKDTKIVLYAPTFRLDTDSFTNQKKAGSFDIDWKGVIQSLTERFGGRWRFAVRLHPKLLNGAEIDSSIIHMTKYPDMQELLYTADVVITDYSSLMWDFALTGKPVFLFSQDIDEYVKNPGFYMPVEKWPYELARTNEELQNIIKNFDYEKYASDLKKHFLESGSYEEGKACSAVLSLIEGESGMKKDKNKEMGNSLIKRIYHFFYYGGAIPLYEKMKHVDFYSEVDMNENGHNKYMMTSLRMRNRLKKYLISRGITEKDRIIDVGCGKGRMLHFFSQFMFGSIDGIEYSRDIAEIAGRNMDRLYGNSAARKRINIMQADAADFEGYDRYNYIYLFNSLQSDLLKVFLNLIKESIRSHPRELQIIYSHAHYGKDVMLDAGFRIVRDFKKEDIIIYEYRASNSKESEQEVHNVLC